jgi:tRNA(Ile)-lysidine synthase
VSRATDEYLFHIVGRPFVDETVEHVGIAVSGGGDSMALLVLTQHWAAARGARMSAVTVDHGLRLQAADEAAMVARACAGRGIAHDILHWHGWDGSGNLQAEARDARYRLIADWAKAKGVETVCLGHTRDDQAETFLMRLARKAGSDGLRGMAERFERHGVRWVRPLLGVGREDLRAFLQRQGVAWVDDPSNEDAGFDRVKARRVLEALAPLGIDAETLSDVARHLAAENGLIRETVAAALQGLVEERCGAVSMAQDSFAGLHPEVRRRFLARAVQWIAGADYPPRTGGVADMEAALLQGGTQTLGGAIGWAGRGRVWLAREYAAVRAMRGAPFDERWHVEGPQGDVEIRALGPEGLPQIPGWRDLGLPRRVLLPTPAAWRGETVIAAPLAGFGPGWRAGLTGERAGFLSGMRPRPK